MLTLEEKGVYYFTNFCKYKITLNKKEEDRFWTLGCVVSTSEIILLQSIFQAGVFPWAEVAVSVFDS